MSFFVVKKCTTKACLLWRIGNQCVRDGASMEFILKYNIAITHPVSICEVRRQMDNYKLERLLEK